MKNLLILTAALFATGFAASDAIAGLNGETITIESRYWGSVWSSTVVVGPGREALYESTLHTGLDLGDDFVKLDTEFANIYGFGAGLEKRFISPKFADFASVSVETNFVGWKDSMVTLTADSLSIKFSNDVSFEYAKGFLNFTLSPAAAPVPEPETIALFGIGLASLFGLATWKRRVK